MAPYGVREACGMCVWHGAPLIRCRVRPTHPSPSLGRGLGEDATARPGSALASPSGGSFLYLSTDASPDHDLVDLARRQPGLIEFVPGEETVPRSVSLGLVAVGAAAPYFSDGRTRQALGPARDPRDECEKLDLWGACPRTAYDPYTAPDAAMTRRWVSSGGLDLCSRRSTTWGEGEPSWAAALAFEPKAGEHALLSQVWHWLPQVSQLHGRAPVFRARTFRWCWPQPRSS